MNASIRCVVFSLDRAMQLDAFLTSVRMHVGGLYDSVTILFRASTGRFAEGYSILRREHRGIEWLEERNFRDDLLSLIEPRGMIVFHTDDDVFFERVEPFDLLLDEACFSLRLGLNIRYSYSLDVPELLRFPSIRDDRVSWDWRAQAAGSFSYPLSLNGHVFRADEARSLIEKVEFSDPNDLESQLNLQSEPARSRMASFTRSCVVSIPANIVTRSFRNRHGALHAPDQLNERFLAGERIAPELMAFNAVAACHEEIPFAYRRRIGSAT
jgi:hypothetical protein